MIAFVNGILDMKLNNFVVIDVSGVGYKVFMSEAARDKLGEVGEKVKVTYVRDNKVKTSEITLTENEQ